MTQPAGGGPALVLNGSPNPEGATSALARALTDRLPGGCRVLRVYDLDIRPCLACGVCAGGEPCPRRDDMRLVWNCIGEAVFLIIASPLHFTSLSAPLVGLIGRLQPAWHARRTGREGPLSDGMRTGALVLTAGSEYRDMFLPARAVAAAAFASLGVSFRGLLAAPGLDAGGDAVGPRLAEAEALAAALASPAGQDAGSRPHYGLRAEE